MNREIGGQWTKRLASGQDKKGKNALTRIENGVETDCCLGILCKMAVEAGVDVKVERVPDYAGRIDIMYDGQTCYLPKSVRIWAGMKSVKGYFKETSFEDNSLAGLNDKSETFGPVIEKINECMDRL